MDNYMASLSPPLRAEIALFEHEAMLRAASGRFGTLFKECNRQAIELLAVGLSPQFFLRDDVIFWEGSVPSAMGSGCVARCVVVLCTSAG
jgi:hypothetical protein